MKRFFDIVLSLFGLVLLSPVFAIVSIWITLETKGPVFYRQLRVGLGGVEFCMLKFRTMRSNADKKGFLTVGDNDLRITNAGRFLRKHKIDEIPQLLNVVLGEMSIVGPRPEVKKYVDYYTPEQRNVLNVLPGITDYASIAYANESELLAQQADPERYYINNLMPEKIKINQVFITNPSISNYFKVILLTFKKLFAI